MYRQGDEQMKRRMALYTRVSTNKEEQKKSLANQEEIYTEYADRNGYELLLPIYAEEGKSGTNSRRPVFKKLLFDGGVDFQENPRGNDIFNESDRKPVYDVILVKDVSRWARNSTDGKSAVERLLAKGVHVIFENSGVSTMDSDWEMRITILFAIAQNESHNMSKRIKFSKQHNARKQIYAPSRVPFGYQRNELNEIVINDEQADVIKHIFQRYLIVGSHIISKELNEKNVQTQLKNKWTPDKITRIIRNTIYTGTAVVNRTTKINVTDTKRSKNTSSDYIEITNAVEPIISLEEWKEANRVKEERTNKNKRVGRKPAKNDIYSEKLYCAQCGSHFVRHIGFGDKINYICQNRRKGLGCKVRGISINNLNKNMENVELSLLVNSMGDAIYYKKLMDKLENQKAELNNIKKDIEQQVDTLDKEIDSIADQYLTLPDGKMKERLIKKVNDKEVQMEELELHLSKLSIETIERTQRRVERKKETIEMLAKAKIPTLDDKLNLLNQILISDYELDFQFSLPSYEEEVSEYNQLFPMNPIETDVPFRPFTNIFKRDHKEAREFWESAQQN